MAFIAGVGGEDDDWRPLNSVVVIFIIVIIFVDDLTGSDFHRPSPVLFVVAVIVIRDSFRPVVVIIVLDLCSRDFYRPILIHVFAIIGS